MPYTYTQKPRVRNLDERAVLFLVDLLTLKRNNKTKNYPLPLQDHTEVEGATVLMGLKNRAIYGCITNFFHERNIFP